MQQLRNRVVKLAASFGLFTGLCGLAVTGCSKTGDASSASKPGTVGVVDLGLVYKAVGWTAEIDDDRKAADQDLKSQLQVYITSVQAAWAERRKELGEVAHLNADQLKIINANQIDGDDFQGLPLTKEQKKEFLQSNAEVSKTLNAAVQVAQQNMQQHESRVNDSYLEAVRPSIRRAAAAAGVTTVLTPNVVLYSDPAVDLSNQVVDDLRKVMPQHAMPALPKLNYPDFHFETAAPGAAAARPVTSPSH